MYPGIFSVVSHAVGQQLVRKQRTSQPTQRPLGTSEFNSSSNPLYLQFIYWCQSLALKYSQVGTGFRLTVVFSFIHFGSNKGLPHYHGLPLCCQWYLTRIGQLPKITNKDMSFAITTNALAKSVFIGHRQETYAVDLSLVHILDTSSIMFDNIPQYN